MSAAATAEEYTMSGATAYLPSEADQLEKLTDDLTTKEWNDVWDVYESRGYDSAVLVANRYKSVFKTRYKVTPADVIDQALERGRMTATEVAKLGPDDAIAKEIDQFFTALAQKYGVAGSSGGAARLTDSGDGSKLATKEAPVDAPRSAYEALVKGAPLSTVSATKAAPVDAFAAAIQGDLRSDMRPR